ALGISACREARVSNRRPKVMQAYDLGIRQIGSWHVVTHSSSAAKKRILQQIASTLSKRTVVTLKRAELSAEARCWKACRQTNSPQAWSETDWDQRSNERQGDQEA